MKMKECKFVYKSLMMLELNSMLSLKITFYYVLSGRLININNR